MVSVLWMINSNSIYSAVWPIISANDNQMDQGIYVWIGKEESICPLLTPDICPIINTRSDLVSHKILLAI